MSRVSDPLAAIAASPSGPAVGAFFDLDGTLVAGFTAAAHAGERIRTGEASIGEVLGVVEASLRYKAGRMKFDRLLQRAATFLGGESLPELDAVAERVFTEHLNERIYPLMRRIVDAHRERGHTLVLCSSALSIHAGPAARALGVPEVICNTFEIDERNVLTGRVQRPIIWGRQKAVAAQGFCHARGVDLAASFFYADGDEDAPLMELVGHPRPVNPRRGLAVLAAARGWPVLEIGTPGRASGAVSALGHLPAMGRAAATRTWRRITSRDAGRR